MDEEDDEIPNAAWRFGPAKLFYDRLHIPTDPDELDYASVFLPNLEGDGGELPNATEERMRLMESAVESIIQLPEESEERLSSLEKSTPQKSKESSFKQNQILDANDNPETEVDVAVASIIQVNDEEDVDSNLGGEEVPDYQCQTGEYRDSPRLENEDGPFSLVAQLEWEKDIIWSPDKVQGNISKEKEGRAGWIPSITNRCKNINCLELGNNWKSRLSFENQDLVTGRWVDDVIWDADEFREQNHQPRLPVFDASNEQFVFNMPKDALPMTESATFTSESAPSALKKKYRCHTKKSKLLLEKTGLFLQPIKAPQQSSQTSAIPTPEMSSGHSSKLTNDFYNISSDQSYQPIKDNPAALKHIRFGDISSRHSKLVRTLTSPFVKILSKEELRNFHRPQLTEKNAPVSTDPYNRHFFKSVTKRIQKKALEWATPLAEEQLPLMDLPIDLSGRDGEILIVENCEEFPPLLSQVGMCSNIINYFQRSSSINDTDNIRIPHSYGETTFVHTLPAPYLGRLEEGQIFSSLENNLYCSPIYYHTPCDTDFLLIRNRHNYMIRNINASFTAGQQCPLVEVPEPNSTKARNFVKELLQVFIYRKFRNCIGIKKQVTLEEIRGTFPNLSESNIRNWMKLAADLKKIGSSTWVVMKSDFKLPTEAELEAMVSPEQYCAYTSMLAAEQRLKDAECNSILSSELVNWDKDGKGLERKKTQRESIGMVIRRHKNYTDTELKDELEAAPWNTTAAFIAASKGKCFMQIDGPADPTGCGEGFSYVRVAKRGSQQLSKEKMTKISSPEKTSAPSRPGGTDADLRRLSTEDAKQLLRKAGVPEMDVKKLSRWEVIDVVRTLSTEKAKLGDADGGISKFSRWNKTGRLMNQARYKENCQRIFELQNKKLSSVEVLKTDDEDEEENNTKLKRWTSEGDIQQFGENIDRILNSDKDKDAQLLHEQEERERVQLQLMMLGKVKAVDAEILRKDFTFTT